MMFMRSHTCPIFGAHRAGSAATSCAVALAALALSIGSASASEIELVRPTIDVVPVPEAVAFEARAGFDSFPSHLLPASAPPPAQRAPDGARNAGVEGDESLLVDAWTISGALGLPPLSPLEMEQPMRLYDSDVLVKFRAPGGRSTFATVELIF